MEAKIMTMTLNVNDKSPLAVPREYAKYILRADAGGGCLHFELVTGVYFRLYPDDIDWFMAMMDRLVTGEPVVRAVFDVPGAKPDGGE